MTNHSRSVTLIELVIVLIILLALAGVGITMYPDLAVRANLVGSLTTLNELNNNFQLVQILASGGITDAGAIPDDLDMLTDIETDVASATEIASGMRTAVLADIFATGPTPAPATAASTVVLPGGFSAVDIAAIIDGDAGAAISPTNPIIAAGVIAAFAARGVNSFALQSPSAGLNVTFDYTGLFADFGAVPVTASPVLYCLDATTVTSLFGITGVLDPVATPTVSIPVYILLGVGSTASHIGTAPGLMEAPVYITDVASPPALITPPVAAPATESDIRDYYSRFMVVYKISATAADDVAISFVGCCAPHPVDGLINGDDFMIKIYSLD